MYISSGPAFIGHRRTAADVFGRRAWNRAPSRKEKEKQTDLLCAVEESVSNVPAGAVADGQAPGQSGRIQVNEETDGEVPEQHMIVMETGAGQTEVGGQTRQQQGQVAEAWDRSDKRRIRERGVGDVERDVQVPEGLRDCAIAAAAAAAAHLTDAVEDLEMLRWKENRT